MSEKLSERLMWVQEALLMVPASLVLALVSIMALASLRDSFEWAMLALALSVLAVACLWRLIFRLYKDGAPGLRASSWLWWSGALLGALIALAAFASHLAPRSEPYSPWAEFRENFNKLALGLPLLLPLIHLACEALFRRPVLPPPSAPAPQPSSTAAPPIP